jgi:hypothetical protein
VRIGQPIRSPDAGQGRQPQRVQPGGFFRPLFGRSKRGHPTGNTGRIAPARQEVAHVLSNSHSIVSRQKGPIRSHPAPTSEQKYKTQDAAGPSAKSSIKNIASVDPQGSSHRKSPRYKTLAPTPTIKNLRGEPTIPRSLLDAPRQPPRSLHVKISL